MSSVDAPVVDTPVETAATFISEESFQNDDIVSGSRIESKFISHLENYKILGAVIEPAGNFLAPTIVRIRAATPESVAFTIKSVDELFDSMLTAVDATILPDVLKRVPNRRDSENQ